MQKVQLGDRRSVEIEPSDKKAIKAILKYAGTKTAAATLIGMGRGTFSQMAKPETRTCANDSRELIRAFAKGNPAVIAGAVAPTKGTVKVQRERKIA